MLRLDLKRFEISHRQPKGVAGLVEERLIRRIQAEVVPCIHAMGKDIRHEDQIALETRGGVMKLDRATNILADSPELDEASASFCMQRLEPSGNV